jgi:ribosome biogenesis GTPase
MDLALLKLGLVPFFTQQLSTDEIEIGVLGRVTEVQRSLVVIASGDNEHSVSLPPYRPETATTDRPTVGDWVLLDSTQARISRILERKSIFQRVAAGGKTEIQLIAANVDTLFIVTSCNEDFKESRLERYLALAAEASVTPVLVLSKIDLIDDANAYAERARRVQRDIPVELVNALDPGSLSQLTDWIDTGTTIALVGSSGVGKSTLLNALAGEDIAATSATREQDKKGRHTTSHRALYQLPGGGLIIDVPGMRELKVVEVETALSTVFEEIERFAAECQFADCQHQAEPGCAVRAAIEAGHLDERRLQNYLKLLRENAHNNASLAEQRSKGRDFAKVIKQAKSWKQNKGSK